jgi:hypothetical protein
MPFLIRPSRRFLLTCFSCFMALFALLVLSSGPVYAEWVTVSVIDQAGATVYVDPDTIHRNGGRVTMWELIDYGTIQTVKGISFLSARLQREYDCAGDLNRTLTLTKLSGSMGTGTVVLFTSDKQKWEPVDPGSIAKRLWKFACDKQ